MRIQVLTTRDCQTAAATRALVLRTLRSLGVTACVEEVDLESNDTPGSLSRHGSPTVLVDGEAVGEWAASEGQGCRLYRHPGGRLMGHPTEEAIRLAIQRARMRAAGEVRNA